MEAQEAPQEEKVEHIAGVPNGTILKTPEGQPDEKVVEDHNEAGVVIGWHKEIV